MPATLCAWVDGHFAAATVEAEREKLAGAETQIAWLLVGGIRIRLAAMPQLKEKAVAASHQVIYHLVIYHVPFYLPFLYSLRSYDLLRRMGRLVVCHWSFKTSLRHWFSVLIGMK